MKHKFSFTYKILIVLLVFIGSFIFFSRDITENFFSGTAATTVMSEAVFPLVSLEVDGHEMNVLHGYAANLDEMIMRESITPIGSDRTFTILIDGNKSDVRKLKYEILNEDGNEIESASFTVLDSETARKRVPITLQETLKSGREYVVKLTLITNTSKRIYYYTRIKMYDNAHMAEKLEFISYFHNTLFDKDKAQELLTYLEPKSKAPNNTFAYVNINSSLDMVSYGDLAPTLVYEAVPTFTEFYDGMASAALNYVVSVETETGTELYTVKENFRFNYTSKRIYLYNYERTMDALFDVNNVSLTKNEFKLGITGDSDAETGISPDKKFAAFEYGRELMLYDSAKNTLSCIFSFRDRNSTDYAHDLYPDHDIRLLRVNDDGSVIFTVYGYMNRGEYEGRVGILLYRYHHKDGRIEELLYMPIATSYSLLEADLNDFSYLNSSEVFFFSIYDSIYSYNLVTGHMEILATDVPGSNLLFCEEEHFIVWQENSDVRQATRIHTLELETGEEILIEAPEGDRIRLLGGIDNNIIYGYAHDTDLCIYRDGSTLLPCYRLIIADRTNYQLKSQDGSGSYFTGIEVNDNIITVHRVYRTSGAGVSYTEAPDDSIMNRRVTYTPPVQINRRITEHMLTEYYVAMPEGMNIESVPTLQTTRNTVINTDTTVRLAEPENRTRLCYTYSFGKIVYSSADVSEAIREADAAVGTVINENGRLLWERGVKSGRYEISGVPAMNRDSVSKGGSGALNSLQACLQILLAYKNQEGDAASYNAYNESAVSWLKKNMKATPVDLTGATLDEVLYYVYKSRPVIALTDNYACVITGYDAAGITVIDQKQKKVVKYSLKEAAEMFDKAGNRFISFVE